MKAKKLLSSEEIQKRVKELALEITEEHMGDQVPVVIIGVLNGCFMFYSDFVRNLGVEVECDFIRAKSYSGKHQEAIQILKDIEVDIRDKYVYLIDDFYDSGSTLNVIADFLSNKFPAAISIITLLIRDTSWRPASTPLYYGFEIKDEWVYGYGLDDENNYKRNYTDVWYNDFFELS